MGEEMSETPLYDKWKEERGDAGTRNAEKLKDSEFWRDVYAARFEAKEKMVKELERDNSFLQAQIHKLQESLLSEHKRINELEATMSHHEVQKALKIIENNKARSYTKEELQAYDDIRDGWVKK